MNGESYHFRESMKSKRSRKSDVKEQIAALAQSGHPKDQGGQN